MARGEIMRVAGLGCRRGTSPEEIEAVVALALEQPGSGGGALDALATWAEKAWEPGIIEAARRLALPLIACSAEDMRRAEPGVVTRSARAEAATGLPSVAETAALAAAGEAARLVVTRVATASATCAIAEGQGEAEEEKK
jgi:cobalt-precorrin 5A hydrolase